MALSFNNNSYSWVGQNRPGKPAFFSQELLMRFLDTQYAQTTTLAAFLRAHPNALQQGVLNQLHRRHIIPWDLIKAFTLKCAVIGEFNREMVNLTRPVWEYFDVGLPHFRQAAEQAHGQQRATMWQKIAEHMCWTDNNVFVGPSAGNVGVALDDGSDLTPIERQQLFAGATYRSSAIVYGIMEGVANA
ncbi:MAG: hypothetical protein JNL32_09585 [Candidatus Kapabacteria bacterium]|nr:hypothetical protein [Candidatus Kapabacteria bacterium]